jgi:hypothetical protein
MISVMIGHTIQNLLLEYPCSHKHTMRSTTRPATTANPASWAARQRPAAFPVAAMSRVALIYPPTRMGTSISDTTRLNGSLAASELRGRAQQKASRFDHTDVLDVPGHARGVPAKVMPSQAARSVRAMSVTAHCLVVAA